MGRKKGFVIKQNPCFGCGRALLHQRSIGGVNHYDNDPLEKVNLAGDPRYAKVVRKLSGELHAFYDRQYRSPTSAPIAAAMQAKGK